MQRLALREGWTTFLLISIVVFTATWSTQKANWADGLGILTGITIVGLLTGLVLSQITRIPSWLAHILALAIGTVVVFYQMTNFLSDNIGGREAKLHYLWSRWTQWYTTISHGQRAEDLYLFILMMGALLFILSYSSVWFVMRSHWIWLSLLLPGVILFMNLGYSLQVPTAFVVIYLFASILLMMRFSFSRKEEGWRLSGTPYPDSIVWRGLWTASYVSFAVIIFGWALPLSTQNDSLHSAWERVNGPWVQVESTFNDWFGALRGPNKFASVGGFASFGDSFTVGGPLRLSNQPVVVVQGSSAPYLAAHRYDLFDGTGWSSDISSTYQSSSIGSSSTPLISVPADQKIPMPESTTKDTNTEKYTVKIVSPRGAVVYSPGQLQSVTQPTQVQVAWHFYNDQKIDLASANEGNTPPLLWPLVKALKSATFGPATPNTGPPTIGTPSSAATPSSTPTAGTNATPTATEVAGTTNGATPQAVAGTPVSGTPEATSTPDTSKPSSVLTLPSGKQVTVNTDDLALIQQTQANLRNHDGISTAIEVGDDAQPTILTFTGQLPVYSDIEAVFAQNGVGAGDSYDITSVVSTATDNDLRQAGTAYPVEITSRYLQLPAVTDRVRNLANQLAAGKNNPYDIAANIETYLRTNLKYNENVGTPPKGEDAVDWFLFDTKQGYCTFYASSMIEMLRVLNIPSRLAVGFYPAAYDSGSNGYLYRDLNAHAWVEVYFPQYGWVPFEPTAARAEINRQPVAATTNASPDVTSSEPGITAAEAREQAFLDENGPVGGGSAGVVRQDSSIGYFGWAVRGMIVVLLALLGVFAYFWLRGLRGLTPTTQLFTKAQRGATWGGVPVRASMTPYERANMIAERVPGSRQHVRYLADLYVRERYGGAGPDAQELSRARHAWLRLRSLMLKFLVVGRWRSSARRRAEPLDDE